jgi:hypothetical protein
VTPVALIVLAAGATAYAYLVDRHGVSDADRAARKDSVVPAFAPGDVRQIELQQGSVRLALERDVDGGAGWAMTSPRREAADPAAVDALVQQLDRARRARDVSPDEAPGLDAPRVRGRLSLGDVEYRFALGGDAPRPEGGAYVRLDGEGTFVVDRDVKAALLRGADDYRDRALVPYGLSETARLEVRSPSGAFVLERAGSELRVGGAGGLRAARDAVDRVFGALAEARAEVFLEDADAAPGPGDVDVALLPREASRPPVHLSLGRACPAQAQDVVAVRTTPTRVAACVAGGLAAALGTRPEALVDDHPLAARADEIEALRLEPLGRTGITIDLARRGTGWHERMPEDRDLSPTEGEAVEAQIAALAAARGSGVHAPAAGAAPETRGRATRVTVERTGERAPEVVELDGPEADGTASARRLDDGAVLKLSSEAAKRFDPGEWAAELSPGDAGDDGGERDAAAER